VALSLGLKRPGREADHSSPSSAEVKKVWSYTSTPLVRLHDVVQLCLYLYRPKDKRYDVDFNGQYWNGMHSFQGSKSLPRNPKIKTYRTMILPLVELGLLLEGRTYV
jgi:hypothetical protein